MYRKGLIMENFTETDFVIALCSLAFVLYLTGHLI